MIRTHLKTLFATTIILVISISFLIYSNSATPPKLTEAQKTLMLIGDRCAGIAENSVANKTALVAFQQLEIQGNKANVIVSCMRDNGYVQNPAWLKYAQPIAKFQALTNNISTAEALTNLGRQDMQAFSKEENRPIYWVKQK
ncbi:MAG: hypothetical protein V4605_09720 [Pseudomonadota bacterium]